MNFTHLLGYVGTWTALCAGAWGFFDKMAKVSSQEFNAKVTQWIESMGSYTIKSKAKEIIYGLFLKFFGERHFSRKCVFRSMLYSTFTMVLIYLIFLHSDVVYTFFVWTFRAHQSFYDISIDIYSIILVYLMLIIQDFLMLYKTRLFLKAIIKSNISYPFLIIALDFFLSVILVFIISYISVFAVSPILISMSGEEVSLLSVFKTANAMVTSLVIQSNHYTMLDFASFGKFYFAGFLGTFWILSIQIVGIFTFLVSVILRQFERFSHVIDIKQKPIESLGAVSVLAITMICLIAAPVFLIMH